MPRTARVIAENGIYHVVNRGNGRAVVFRKPADFDAFVHLIGEAKAGTGGSLNAENEVIFANLESPVPAGSRVAFFAGPKKVTKERTLWRCARHFCCLVFRMLTMTLHQTSAVLPATEGGGLWIRPPGGCLLSRVDGDHRREFTAFGARIRIGPALRAEECRADQ